MFNYLLVADQGSKNRKNYSCSTCYKNFQTRNQLSKHLILHVGTTPFECGYCGHRFSQRANQEKHVRRIHLSEKSHFCNQCPSKFFDIYSLNLHQQRHERTKVRYNMCDLKLTNELQPKSSKNPFVGKKDDFYSADTEDKISLGHIGLSANYKLDYINDGKTNENIIYECPHVKCEEFFSTKKKMEEHFLFIHISCISPPEIDSMVLDTGEKKTRYKKSDDTNLINKSGCISPFPASDLKKRFDGNSNKSVCCSKTNGRQNRNVIMPLLKIEPEYKNSLSSTLQKHYRIEEKFIESEKQRFNVFGKPVSITQKRKKTNNCNHNKRINLDEKKNFFEATSVRKTEMANGFYSDKFKSDMNKSLKYSLLEHNLYSEIKQKEKFIKNLENRVL